MISTSEATGDTLIIIQQVRSSAYETRTSLGSLRNSNFTFISKRDAQSVNSKTPRLMSVEIERTGSTEQLTIEVGIDIFEYFEKSPAKKRLLPKQEICTKVLADGERSIKIFENLNGMLAPRLLEFRGFITIIATSGVDVGNSYISNTRAQISEPYSIGNVEKSTSIFENFYRAPPPPTHFYLPKLSSEIVCLLGDEEHLSRDAILKCGNSEVEVYGKVLSLKSSFFKKKFETPMQEDDKCRLEISDITFPQLLVLLVYIYSGKVDDFGKCKTADILVAADKYRVKELKQMCVTKLISELSVNNAWEIFSLGHLYDKKLKKKALGFIIKKDLFSTEEYGRFQKENPLLASEVENIRKENQTSALNPNAQDASNENIKKEDTKNFEELIQKDTEEDEVSDFEEISGTKFVFQKLDECVADYQCEYYRRARTLTSPPPPPTTRKTSQSEELTYYTSAYC